MSFCFPIWPCFVCWWLSDSALYLAGLFLTYSYCFPIWPRLIFFVIVSLCPILRSFVSNMQRRQRLVSCFFQGNSGELLCLLCPSVRAYDVRPSIRVSIKMKKICFLFSLLFRWLILLFTSKWLKYVMDCQGEKKLFNLKTSHFLKRKQPENRCNLKTPV
jgi:hypothetical protein